MYAGRPVIYTTFLAYDEVAHHSGIERPTTLATLAAASIGRSDALASAAERTPRHYELVVLSDHGQSQGGTFLRPLRDLAGGARRGAGQRAGTATVRREPERGAGLPRRVAHRGGRGQQRAGQDASARLSRGHERRRRGPPRRGARQPSEDAAKANRSCPEVVVMASGCLGLISFPREPGRVTLERLADAAIRASCRRCATIPGIGFVLVRSERARRRRARRARARNYLDEGRVEGEDPLAPYGPNAARHVQPHRRLPALPRHRPQQHLLARMGRGGGVRGAGRLPRRPRRQPVASRSCCTPSSSRSPSEELVGAEAVHRELRRWLVQLGHSEYGDVREVGAAAAVATGAPGAASEP